jgi:endonuclease/exonuclease/phosphatase family metal-dependent hydrolase
MLHLMRRDMRKSYSGSESMVKDHESVGGTDHLRIATYNIHKSRGLDRRLRPQRILEVLRELDADLIALQEVVSRKGSGREEDQERYFAEELGYYSVMGENRTHEGGAYGNVLLTRFPMHSFHNYDISAAGRERRGCLRADVRLGETVLHIFNVHMGTAFFERRKQALKLLGKEILERGELAGARIVLGDFNEWSRGLASRLFATRFHSADPHRYLGRANTYPGVLPFLHLDHIYFDPSLKLNRLSLHRTRKALLASDHLPLVADFTWHAPGASRSRAPVLVGPLLGD